MSSELDRQFDEAKKKEREDAAKSRERRSQIDRLTEEAVRKCAKEISDTVLNHPNLKGSFSRDPGPFATGDSFKCSFPGVSRPVNVKVWGTVACDLSQSITMPHQDPSWNAFIISGKVQAWNAKTKSTEYPLDAKFNVSGQVVMNLAGTIIEAAKEVARGD